METSDKLVHTITAVEGDEGYNVNVSGSNEGIMNIVACGVQAIMQNTGVSFEDVVEALENNVDAEVI